MLMSPENGYTPPDEMPPSPIHRVLVGQKALVTGASKGLGQAMAIGFARAGADVLVNYSTDEQGARKTAAIIEEHGGKAVIFKANVSRETDVKAMFDCMLQSFGRVDICVPNAAIQLNANVNEMTLEQWQNVIDVNLTGNVSLCPGSDSGFQATRNRWFHLLCLRQAHIHELGARHHSLGRPRELRRGQGRPHVVYEEFGPGSFASAHPSKRHLIGGDSNSDEC
jgi:NAD(P)-dependent dehydrogenase (short-subunit alcohol dehydrogenase family)